MAGAIVLVLATALSLAPTAIEGVQEGSPRAATLFGSPASHQAATGLTRREPAALGQEVVTGAYAATLFEATHGQEAAARVAAANRSNPPPPTGTEYVLAKVRVRHAGAGSDSILVAPSNVGLTGSASRLYPAADVVPPQPELRGQLDAGGELEGYVVLSAAAGESDRQLVLQPNVGLDPATFRYLALDAGDSLPPSNTPVAAPGSPSLVAGAGANDVGRSQDAPAAPAETVATDTFALQVAEFVSGDEATARLKRASAFNPEPLPGNEHALFLVRVTYVGGDEGPAAISPLDFSAIGGVNARYAVTGLVPPPPELDARLYPGGTVEGYLAFEVRQGDPDLALVYQPSNDPDAEPRYLAGASVVGIATPAP